LNHQRRGKPAKAYRPVCDGDDVGAVNPAIAVDIPARVDGRARLNVPGQSERIKNIDPSIMIDIFAAGFAGARRAPEQSGQPDRQRETGRHGGPGKPLPRGNVGTFKTLQMFARCPQHLFVHCRGDEQAFLVKILERFDEAWRCLEVFTVEGFVSFGHTIFNRLSRARLEKVH